MRTPKEIAEYIDYYKDKPKAEREWALKNLEKIEGKPLKELIEYSRRDGIRCRKTLSDDIKEQIKQAVRAGVSNLDIIADFGVSHNTVTRIKNAMRQEGEVLPETRGRRPREEQPAEKQPAEKQPEAYPGQINDDEPIVEDDVQAYVRGEIKTEPPTASDCKKPEVIDEPPAVRISNAFQNLADSLHTALFGEPPDDEPEEEEIEEEKEPEQPETPWKALSEQICDFAVGTFGAGTRITSVFWSEDDSTATVCMKTPDDRIIQITMEER